MDKHSDRLRRGPIYQQTDALVRTGRRHASRLLPSPFAFPRHSTPAGAPGRGVGGAPLAVGAVHAGRPAGHLAGGELAVALHPKPPVEVLLVGEERQLAARPPHPQAAPVELPQDPLALFSRVRGTPLRALFRSEILSGVPLSMHLNGPYGSVLGNRRPPFGRPL